MRMPLMATKWSTARMLGGKYHGTWQATQASWVTIVRSLWGIPTLPKAGY